LCLSRKPVNCANGRFRRPSRWRCRRDRSWFGKQPRAASSAAGCRRIPTDPRPAKAGAGLDSHRRFGDPRRVACAPPRR
jgi:hypothetical protein